MEDRHKMYLPSKLAMYTDYSFISNALLGKGNDS